MKILIIHQNFPGQFREIAPNLISKGHEIKAICSHDKEVDSRIRVRRYKYVQGDIKGVHPLTKEIDEWVSRSELVAKEAEILRFSDQTQKSLKIKKKLNVKWFTIIGTK